jgi:YVTN family beta-propeller protein
MNDKTMEPRTSAHNFIYYGDITNNRVVTFDVSLMKLSSTINSDGLYPYEIANGLDKELYILNRHDNMIGVIDSSSNTIIDEITLPFYPRSISKNSINNILLTSTDKPSALIINNNSTSTVYSDSKYKTPLSYGGDTATGHPIWVDDNYFLLLDRTENTIELYEKYIYKPIDKVRTKSSVHHVITRSGIFYGICEGKRNGISPEIIKFTISNGRINIIQERLLSSFDNLPLDFTKDVWGSHHASFHPTEDYIYMGSTEGNVFVLNLNNLELVDTFKAGKGVGHFSFYKNMLITTNHYDTIKTFHDISNPTNTKYITSLSFGDTIYRGITMQSHTSHIIDNNLYFMFNTDTDSTLYEVDLDSITIKNKITLLDHYCLMGSIVSDSVTSSEM